MEIIKSRQNKKAKFYRNLLQKKYRTKENLFLAEGPVVIREALDFVDPKYVAIEDKKDFGEIINLLEERKIPYDIYDREVFETLSDTKTPQGIIGYFEIKNLKFEEKPGKYLYLDGVKDPGNVGTIIRTAEAFGIDGVLLSSDCVELYSPKVVRSTMASIFRTKVYRDIDLLKLKNKFKIVCADLEGKSIREKNDWEDTIVVIGSEAQGVSEEILKIADETVLIPMDKNIDSLNAAVAASLFMYEMTK